MLFSSALAASASAGYQQELTTQALGVPIEAQTDSCMTLALHDPDALIGDHDLTGEGRGGPGTDSITGCEANCALHTVDSVLSGGDLGPVEPQEPQILAQAGSLTVQDKSEVLQAGAAPVADAASLAMAVEADYTAAETAEQHVNKNTEEHDSESGRSLLTDLQAEELTVLHRALPVGPCRTIALPVITEVATEAAGRVTTNADSGKVEEVTLSETQSQRPRPWLATLFRPSTPFRTGYSLILPGLHLPLIAQKRRRGSTMVRKAVTRQIYKLGDQNVASPLQDSVTAYSESSLRYADVAHNSTPGSLNAIDPANLSTTDASGLAWLAGLMQDILSGKRLGSLLSGMQQSLQKLRLCWDPGSVYQYTGGCAGGHNTHAVHSGMQGFAKMAARLTKWSDLKHKHYPMRPGVWHVFQDAVGSFFKRHTARPEGLQRH